MVNKQRSGAAAGGRRPGAPEGPRRRTRGRPRSGARPAVREALLEAARALFLRHGFRGVSSRQIAGTAGVNVAMIGYYFGGKAGLYREILAEVLTPLREGIDAMAGGRAPVDLAAVLGLGMRTWMRSSWMAGSIVREVLAEDGPVRALFLREVGGRLAPVLESVIAGEIRRGRLCAELDPRLTALSMVSLIVFPFLAYAVTSRLFEVRRDEAFVERLVRHTTNLLLNGLSARPRAP